MTDPTPSSSSFFVTGGTLPLESASYVSRPADEELLRLTLAGEYCNVLTARQMGKSSLMVRTADRLKDRKVRTVIIDLNAIGSQVTDNEWYFGLVTALARQLKLATNEQEWWQTRTQSGAVQRFNEFLRNVVLEEIRESIVVFIDEVDSTLKRSFTDDFFANIRAAYNARATDQTYERITFVLLGVTRPAALIKDRTTTPYNIGNNVEVTDFQLEELGAFHEKFEADYPAQGEEVLKRILYWTGGQPYLTQKISADLIQRRNSQMPPAKIDAVVEADAAVKRLLTEGARNETNLRSIRDQMKSSPYFAAMLRIYRDVLLNKKKVPYEERSVEQNELKLTGLVRVTSQETLAVRNRLYARVFDEAWVRENTPVTGFAVVGGPLHPESASYVIRPADKELFNQALIGEYCNVLAARQMGKSSLMVQTASRLDDRGLQTVRIDLTTFRSEVTAQEWYFQLMTEMARQLSLETQTQAWREINNQNEAVPQFGEFLRDVVLKEVHEAIVVFIDGVDSVLRWSSFTDDFFAAIQSAYTARATNPDYKNLTFVLLGVARLADLIKDRKTPYNIGKNVEVTDFRLEELDAFREKFEAAYPKQGKEILERIWDWTGGQPYLTQKISADLIQPHEGKVQLAKVDAAAEVKAAVERLFLAEGTKNEPNLQSIRDRVKKSPYLAKILRIYRDVLRRKQIPNEEGSVEQNELKLIGLVRVTQQGTLDVRNQLYARVFDEAWVRKNTLVNRMPIIAGTAGIVVALVVGVILLLSYVNQQSQTAEIKAQTFTQSFQSNNPEMRLTGLAGLFNLGNPYAQQARDKFFGLSSQEQLFLFTLPAPQNVANELVIVIGGVCQRLQNTPQDNELLKAMSNVLRQVSASGASGLKTEIDSWLQGRELADAGQYRSAITLYTKALSESEQRKNSNAGILCDRAAAHLALREYDLALTDFEASAALDKDRQTPIKNQIVSVPQLLALWSLQSDKYPELSALLPTPTPTLTPTPTPTLTATPTSTPTLTPIPTKRIFWQTPIPRCSTGYVWNSVMNRCQPKP